jgi:probable phosphoglycerate mutase
MIYFIRHGQTEFNVARRYQGSLDSSLTGIGRAQAQAMGERLRDLIDPATATLFVSPLGRTRATAQIIADAAGITATPIIDADLAEIGLGSWEGKTAAEIDTLWPGILPSLHPLRWYFETPDGERYEDFSARLSAALTRVKDHPAPTKIMISHGVAGRVMRGIHAGLAQDDALALPVQHGIIFRYEDNNVSEIDCNPPSND